MNRDLTRQVSVLVLAVVAIFGAAWGAGAFGGTPTSEAADGALSASATPVAPGTTAFSIWSVIYLGLIAYAVWQALPAQRESARQRSMGWLAAVSMLLNAGCCSWSRPGRCGRASSSWLRCSPRS